MIHELRLGRKLAGEKKWDEALEAFDRALSVEPNHARVLAEAGWVAFQGGDLTRAKKNSESALARAADPKLRAQILYNMGRVAEGLQEKEEAKKAYQASLALRDNAQVKKRLESMGGVIDPTRELELPCLQGHANIDALCTCLQSHKESLNSAFEEGIACEREPEPALPDPRLTLVRWGGGGETVHMLVAKEGARVRVVADLGRDFTPGAMGVNNGAQVKGAEARTVANHTVVIVRSEQINGDANMGGLELYSSQDTLETVCALGDAPGATRCTPAIPVESVSSYGLGYADDPSEVDEEWREMAREIKSRESTTRSKRAWTLADDGKVTVRVLENAKEALPAGMAGPHVLW